MNNPANPFGSSYQGLKKQIRDIMYVELEGTLNPNSPEDMIMAEQLFGEVLAEENIVLSRAEKQRLFDDVVAELTGRMSSE
jgi:pilus assembly protein CpaF